MTHPANEYRCVAASPAGFLRQLTTNILPYGFRYYFAGCIREPLKPERTDQKIIEHYQLAHLTKDRLSYYRQKQISVVRYLRYGRFYVILATEGSPRTDVEHCFHFFVREKKIRNIRESPIHFQCYLISRKIRLDVSLDCPTYKELASKCMQHAPHWKRPLLEEFIKQQFAQFEAYGGVRAQFSKIVGEINEIRKKSGHKLISAKLYRKYPRVVKVWHLQQPRFIGKNTKVVEM